MLRPQNRINDRTLRHLRADGASAYDRANGGDFCDRVEPFYVRVEPSASKVVLPSLSTRRSTRGAGPIAGCSATAGGRGVSLANVHEKRDGERRLLRPGLDPFDLDQRQQHAEKRAWDRRSAEL